MKEIGADDNRKIEIVTSKKANISGIATINGTWIKMKVPSQQSFDVKSFVRVLTHELHHNLGLRHKEMVGLSLIDTSWTDGLQVNKKVPIEGEKIPLIKQRYDHAVRKLEEKERQLRRIQIGYNRWKTKVNYYEKTWGMG